MCKYAYITGLARSAAIAILLLLTIPLSAQGDFTGYLEPELSLNYSLGPHFSQNITVSHRMYYREEGQTRIRGRQADLALFTDYSILGGQNLGLGIQYRFRRSFEPGHGNELRITEQYNRTHHSGALRFGHRFRMEQRIIPSGTIHRFRYRLALDGPLQGERADVKEFYWISALEQLLSSGRGMAPEWDVRILGEIGYKLDAVTRVQFGLEYRIEDYYSDPGNVLFLTASLILAL